jgi:hypothetical protein
MSIKKSLVHLFPEIGLEESKFYGMGDEKREEGEEGGGRESIEEKRDLLIDRFIFSTPKRL